MLLEEAGVDFTGYFANTNDIKIKFKTKLQATKDCPKNQANGNCWHNGTAMWKNLSGESGWENTGGFSGLILRNGAYIAFDLDTTACDDSNFEINIMDVQCGDIMLDINGIKPPNTGGRDIFTFKIIKTGIYPTGSEGESSYSSSSTPENINRTNYTWCKVCTLL